MIKDPKRTSGASSPLPGSGEPITLRNILVFAAALLWLVLPIVVFFIFHKPLPPAALERIRDVLIDLSAAGWIVGIGIGIGLLFVRGGNLSALERTALSGALGLGVLGLIILGTAWAGPLSGGMTALLCTALTLLISMPFLREARAFLGNRPRGFPLGGVFSAILGAFIAVSLLLSLGIALAPPTAWDSLVYHFRIPEQILSSGSLLTPGDSLFREMPQLVEMLYTAAIALTGRPETAAVLGWAIGLLALLGITGMARRWGLRHSLLPAALLLAGDTLAKSMGWGYVDWAAALFGFAAMCAISQKESGAGWILLAGVFSGLAAGTKYTAGIVLAALILAILSLRGWKRSLKEAALLLGGFLLAFWPWIVRGLAYWGNPLPPLMDAGQLAALKVDFFGRGPLPNGWLLAVPMPLLQSMVGREGGFPFDATIGPLLIALLPGALLKRKEESAPGAFLRRLFWISAILYWVVAGVGSLSALQMAQPRLFIALFPAIALLSAYGFERLWELRLLQIRLGAVAAVLTVLIFAAQAIGFVQAGISAGIPEYLAGTLTREDYLENNLGWYARAMAAARTLPEGSRVLMLWEPRGLYCGDGCREDATIDRWYLLMRSGGTADGILAGWRREGWTHILFFETGAEFERGTRSEYSASDWEALERLLAALPVAERFGDGYTLYSLE